MTTAAPEAQARGSTTQEEGQKPADVFVVFGITGDLAKVMTFHSLYRLEQRGLLDCPIVGVAVDDWTVDQLKDRARESIEGTGESIDETIFDRLADRSLVRLGRLRRRRDLRAGRPGDRRNEDCPSSTSRFRRSSSAGSSRASPTRASPRPAGSWWRSRSGTIVRRRPSSRTSSTSTWTSPSSTGSTTTSGRWGSRRSSTCASRTRCSSRCGAGTTSSRVQITMAEDFGVEDRGHFYDPVGALRDVVVNHLMQVVAASAMEIPSRRGSEFIKNAQVALFHAVADADPAHYVRGQYEGYLDIDGVAVGLDHRDLRGAPARHRELALGGRSVLHPDGQAARGHADRAPPRLQARAAARVPARHGPPEPNQLVVKLDPSTGIRLVLDAHRADRVAERRPSSSEHGVRRGGR